MDESSTNYGEITALLNDYRNGDRGAFTKLIDIVYPQLCKIARNKFRQERPDHTLQPEAVVHETYLLVKDELPDLENRGEFFAFIAHAMCRVLIEYARKKNSLKNGGKYPFKVSLDDVFFGVDGQKFNYVELEDALAKLAGLDKRQATIVYVRYIAGFSVEETAKIFNVSERTVKREWRSAQAWLFRYLQGEDR
jgi:RNA polymerase sigma factor (TIGR02999 family)